MYYFTTLISTTVIISIAILTTGVALAQTDADTTWTLSQYQSLSPQTPTPIRVITPEMRARIQARLQSQQEKNTHHSLQVAYAWWDEHWEDIPMFAMDHIDTMAVQQAWLSWINEERANYGVAPLTLDIQLMATSIEWANHIATNKQFSNTHSRPGQTTFYDGWLILQRAKSLWLIDDSISVIAESTIRWSANFTSTETLIASIKGRTWWPSGWLGFLLGEKRYARWSRARVHYDMLMNPNYTKVGFGFANAGTHPSYPSRWSQYMGVIHFSH